MKLLDVLFLLSMCLQIFLIINLDIEKDAVTNTSIIITLVFLMAMTTVNFFFEKKMRKHQSEIAHLTESRISNIAFEVSRLKEEVRK